MPLRQQNKLSNFVKRNFNTLILLSAVFIIAVSLSAIMVNLSVARIHAAAENRFRAKADAIVAAIDRQYRGSAMVLRSMQGFFSGSDNVTRKEFYSFVRTSDFYSIYSGFSTFAYIPKISEKEKEAFLKNVRADVSVISGGYPHFAIAPAGTREEYWPILYVYPEDSANALLGVDQRAESVRAENISRARDLGTVSISKAVQLMPKNKLGVIIAAPLYRNKSVPNTLEERQAMFSGAVTSAFYLDDFFEAIVPKEKLQEDSIGMAIEVRAGDKIIYAVVPEKNSAISQLYGSIQLKYALDLDVTPFYFTFSSPVSAQLSQLELLEPFLYVIAFFSIALFIASLILVFQRMQKLSELQKHYDFVSTLSHQLRTPVTILLWRLEMLKTKANQKQDKQYLVNATKDLNSIVNKMLLYLEITKKSGLRKKEAVPIRSICKKAMQNLPSHLDQKRIVCKKDNNYKTLEIFADAERIALVFSYIMDNALTYGRKQDKVLVKISTEANMVEVKISDSGYGIPEAEQKNLFAEFFRASNASLGKNVGSGVSLFLAKMIVEDNGGTIAFSDRAGGGSVFTVRLPIYKGGK
jgi:signal transduction histidine kinase